jgi:hypothetical protein
MKTFLAAAALAVALPAVAHAQATPANPPAKVPAPADSKQKCCCEEMMGQHGDHQRMKHDMPGHQGHDMGGHQQHTQPE